MKRIKKMLCLLLALVLVGGTVLPNIKAKAENTGAIDKSTVSGIHVRFEGTLLEDTQQTVYEPDEEGKEISFTGYNIHDLKPYVMVFFNDGREPIIYDEWYKVFQNPSKDFGEDIFFRTMQNQTPYTVGEDNTVKVTFLGHECETKVTVVYNPIREISVKATKPLYTNSDMVTQHHMGNPELEYKVYNINQTMPQITVVEKNGSEYQFSQFSDLKERYGYDVRYTSDQSYTNHWTLKENEEQATFKGTVSFMGKTVDFDVELQRNPIAEIEAVYHGVVIEGMSTQPDHYKMEYLFTFADGNTEKFYSYNTILGRMIAPVFEAQDTEEDGTWTAGTHYWKAQVCGIDILIETDVKKASDTPIASISAVATTELVPEWHTERDYIQGEWKDVLRIQYCKPEITLAYSDGTSVVMSYEQLCAKYPEAEVTLEWIDDKTEALGKRTAKLSVYGKDCEFEVDIIDNPVERISAVATKPYLEGYTRDLYDVLMHCDVVTTVYYKDGRTFKGAWDQLGYQFCSFAWEDTLEHVVVGKNVKKMYFLGHSCDLEFEVIPNPNLKKAVSLEAKVKGDIYQKKNSYTQTWYRYDHLIEAVLTFDDGTKLEGSLNEINKELSKFIVDEVYTTDTQGYEEWGVGKHSSIVSYQDLETEIEVEVKANPYTKAIISEGKDGFTVTLEQENASPETYQVNRYEPGAYNGMSFNMYGYFETDKGFLPVEAKFAGGIKPNYSKIEYMFINGVKSNSLEGCKWIETQVTTRIQGDAPEVTLNHSADELKEMVLTDADYKDKNVEGVVAWLEIANKTDEVSSNEQQLLDQATGEMGSYKNGTVVDLTVYKQFPSDEGASISEKVPQLKEEISITMAVPEEILASTVDPSTIKMVRIHNGETQVLPCVYDATNKTITFKTDSFSTYAIAYETPQAPSNKEPGDNTSNESGTSTTKPQTSNTNESKTQDSATKKPAQSSPKTGDHNTIVIYILLCAVSLMSLVVGKKKEF